MVRKYTGSKASVKTAEALAREGLKQEEKSEKAMEAQKSRRLCLCAFSAMVFS